ncbi:hypothetical protein OAL10_04100 [Gammaproteobacteria bacterium]|nr:hypothetical protein [Gammaproteobacteria bacterium]
MTQFMALYYRLVSHSRARSMPCQDKRGKVLALRNQASLIGLGPSYNRGGKVGDLAGVLVIKSYGGDDVIVKTCP